ncbi:MAG TPA: hypothetical protein VN031_03965 [Candidatus Microsaccharimonas sp.]|nr:hypothetical protein [Candidatus Microsaccharimonas sp.]
MFPAANNNEDISADDALEQERPADFNYRIGQEQLPEDNDTPAAPASPVEEDTLPDTHPAKDTGIDSDETYQEGL